jgi:hypothetical protein
LHGKERQSNCQSGANHESHPRIDCVKSLVDPVKSSVDPFEPLVNPIESSINFFESSINLIESSVNHFKAKDHFGLTGDIIPSPGWQVFHQAVSHARTQGFS